MPARVFPIWLGVLLLFSLVSCRWLPGFKTNATSKQIEGHNGEDAFRSHDLSMLSPQHQHNIIPAPRLNKRTLHPPVSAKKWDELVAIGAGKLQEMWDEDENHSQAPFDVKDLGKWGWEEQNVSSTYDLVAQVEPFNGLKTVRGIPNTIGVQSLHSQGKKKSQWGVRRIVQSQRYSVADPVLAVKSVEATKAVYGGIYNFAPGFISITENITPRMAKPGLAASDLPHLQALGDVVFLEYAKLNVFFPTTTKTVGRRHPITWLHFQCVKDDDNEILGVVTTVMNMTGHQINIPESGVTIPIGTKAYNALLSIPMLQDFANLLSRHKFRFGRSVITSITIYNSGAQTIGSRIGYNAPAFLVHTSSIDERVERIMSENESYEGLHAAANWREYEWPNRLRPILNTLKLQYWVPPVPSSERALAHATNQNSSQNLASVAGPSNQQGPLSSRGQSGMRPTPEADERSATNATNKISKRMDEMKTARLQELESEGLGLLHSMTHDAESITQSQSELTAIDLRWMAWQPYEEASPNLESIQFLEGLVRVEGLEDDDLGQGSGRRTRPESVSLRQPKEWLKKLERHEAPGWPAHVDYLYSYEQGVIALLDVKSPWPENFNPVATQPYSERWSGPYPDIRDWSDLALIRFFREANRNGKAAPPRWWPILPSNDKAIHPHAEEVLEAILEENGLSSIPEWPGVTLPIGTSAYARLLATPPVKPIAMSLIHRKNFFGDAVIGSITVFDRNPNSQAMHRFADVASDDDHSRDPDLAFLVYVQRRTPRLEDMSRANAAFELTGKKPLEPKTSLQPTGPLSTKTINWPFPMRPINCDGVPSMKAGVSESRPNRPEGPPGPASRPHGRPSYDPVRESSGARQGLSWRDSGDAIEQDPTPEASLVSDFGSD